MKKILIVLICIGTLLATTACGSSQEEGSSEKKGGETSNGVKQQFISLNEPVTNGYFDFTITSSEWLEEIRPPSPSGAYSYRKDNPGEVYFVVHGKGKSNFSKEIYLDSGLEVKLKVGDKYNYSGSTDIIAPDGSDMDSSIKPLQEAEILLMFSVPDEVKNSTEPMYVTIGVGDGDEYINSDGSNLTGWYTIEFKNN